MKNFTFGLGVLFTTLALPVYAAQPVGKVSFAKGSNAAQQPNANPRLLGKDADVFQGDNIQTSDGSFVIVEFNDGSKVTIRPNSNFKIEQFDTASKNTKLTVYEGGVRATTGEFAKDGTDNFQIKTPTATLKGKGNSDYSVRVCKEDCDKEKKAELAKDSSVAKIVDIKGDVFAKNRVDKNADGRKLAIGTGLNPQDFLISQANSYAVMVFRDNQKITLQANSEFDIVKYDFEKKGEKDQLLFKLATGGMRALTGSIGKKDHASYEVDTPVSTIGIRGTDYDFQCNISSMGVSENCERDGAYLQVNEGAVSQTNAAGEKVFYKGETGFVASKDSAPELKPIPKEISKMIDSSPPARNAPDADKVFERSLDNSRPGTYTIVNKGDATLEPNGDESLDKRFGGLILREGESSFAGEKGGDTVKLESVPIFIGKDDTPAPTIFSNNANIPTTTLFSTTIDESTAKNNGESCIVEQ